MDWLRFGAALRACCRAGGGPWHATYRSDIYRMHLAAEAADLPAASDKAEGLLAAPMPVPSLRGTLILGRNQFFDGKIFDPAVVV